MYMCGMSHRTVHSHHIEAWVDGDRKRGKERVKGGYREKGGRSEWLWKKGEAGEGHVDVRCVYSLCDLTCMAEGSRSR